jgi:tetratricopeptide (TPR) repeat protein
MTTARQQPGGDLETALKHALDTLRQDPFLAKKQAEQILAVYPDVDAARLVLGIAWRLLGDPQKALSLIEPLASPNGGSADLLYEYGMCLGAAGRGDEAIEALEKVVQLETKHARGWRSLGDLLTVAGKDPEAKLAYEKHIEVSARHPDLITAAGFLHNREIAKAEKLIRDVLKRDPVDVVAIRMLADIGLQVGQFADAENLLKRSLELQPDYHHARHTYVMTLSRRGKLAEALVEVDKLLKAEPNNPNYLILKGTVLVRKGDHRPALDIYERVLKDYPRQARAHMSYGHTLKTVGRIADSIRAYRTCIELSPDAGEAYWSLANLKTYQFDDSDIAAMRRQVVPEGGDAEDQAHLAFALGKALEDRHQYDESFQFYERGNRIRRMQRRYSAKINVFNTARQIKALDAEFFAARSGWGCPSPDPIFIVGLPRAGSTLLEQILASHSCVEGTDELPHIIGLSRQLGQKSRKNPASYYPEILTELSKERVSELGERYMANTRVHRRGTPFFIDKMPNNFQHIGLIHLILPQAKIIDARRHPMAGCFSCFKQLFARGQTFTYDLTDLGHYYRDYVKLMDHWDEVLPGRVLRVQYEDMVTDAEKQIRLLLDYCGLNFEEQCLRFYETDRAVRTPSAEQVRKPMYKEGLEHWRNYEEYLGPLKEALGPVLQRYPV